MRKITNYIQLNDNRIMLANTTNPMTNKYPQILLLTEDFYNKSWKFTFFMDKADFDKNEYIFETRRYLLPQYMHNLDVEEFDVNKYKVTLSYTKPTLFNKIQRFFRRRKYENNKSCQKEMV